LTFLYRGLPPCICIEVSAKFESYLGRIVFAGEVAAAHG